MEVNFKDVYKPPFRIANCDITVRSDNGVPAFTAFSEKSRKHMLNIMNILNGEAGEKYSKDKISVSGAELSVDGCKIGVRGWGYLTGGGALNLDVPEAVKVQDAFIAWVVSKITN